MSKSFGCCPRPFGAAADGAEGSTGLGAHSGPAGTVQGVRGPGVAGGSAVSVVVAHGWLSPPSSWARLARLLTRSGVVLHLVEGFDGPYPSLRLWAQRLSALAAETGAVGVVGHSLGATPAMQVGLWQQLPVALVAPSALPRHAVSLAGCSRGRLTVFAPELDLLCAADACRLAGCAGAVPVSLPGVTHAGFLDPAADRLSRVALVRSLEKRSLRARSLPDPASPAWQVRALSGALSGWLSRLAMAPLPAASR